MASSLDDCRCEINIIISELQDIEAGIRNSFSGIGQNICADKLNDIINKYIRLSRKLDNIDQNRLADWYIEMQQKSTAKAYK